MAAAAAAAPHDFAVPYPCDSPAEASALSTRSAAAADVDWARQFDEMDDELGSCEQEVGLPQFYGHSPLIVKNTFLDCPAFRTQSLEEFLKERNVVSCPATRLPTADTPRTLQSTPRMIGGRQSTPRIIGGRHAPKNSASSLETIRSNGDTPSNATTRSNETDRSNATTARSNDVDRTDSAAASEGDSAYHAGTVADYLSAMLAWQTEAGTQNVCSSEPELDAVTFDSRSTMCEIDNAAGRMHGRVLAPPPGFWPSAASTPFFPEWFQNASTDLVDNLSGGAWGSTENPHFSDTHFFPPPVHHHLPEEAEVWQHPSSSEAEFWQELNAQGHPFPFGFSDDWSAAALHAGQEAAMRPVFDGDLPSFVGSVPRISVSLASLCEEPEPRELAPLGEEPDLGASLGSAVHGTGQCKPCVFVHKAGCRQGSECPFCHLCKPEERKKRRWQKLHEQQRLRRQEARRLAAEEKEREADETTRMADEDFDVGKLREATADDGEHFSVPRAVSYCEVPLKGLDQAPRGVSFCDVTPKELLLRPL